MRVGQKVMGLLLLLAERPGDVVSRDRIVANLWEGAAVTDEAVSTLLYELRRALGDAARAPRFVETIRKSGYRLLLEPEPLRAPIESPPAESSSVVEVSPGTVLETKLPPAAEELDIGQPHEAAPMAEVPAAHSAPGSGGATVRRPLVVLLAAVFVGVVLITWWIRPLLPGGGPQPVGEAPIRSLAILPLTAVTQECRETGVADGLTRMLTSALVSSSPLEVVDGLPVPADAGAWQARQAARELEVDAVIEGAVAQSGDELWVSVELVEPLTGRLLWGGSFERRAGEVVALQRDLAGEIARQIQRRIGPADSRPEGPAGWDAEALQDYRLGLHFLNQGTPRSTVLARRHFAEAVAREPSFASGHAGLASSFLLEAELESVDPEAVRTALSEAEAAADRALELDSGLPAAHVARGAVSLVRDRDWNRAAEHFGRGCGLGGACGIEESRLQARYLASVGRLGEGIGLLENALRDEPSSASARWTLAWLYYLDRRFESAVALLGRVRLEAPEAPALCRLEEDVFAAVGREAAAAEAAQRSLVLSGQGPLRVASLQTAFQRGGLTGLQRWLLEEGETSLPGEPAFDTLRLARAGARLGETEAALEWLFRAESDGHPGLPWIAADPAFDPLRGEPRFEALAARLSPDFRPSGAP